MPSVAGSLSSISASNGWAGLGWLGNPPDRPSSTRRSPPRLESTGPSYLWPTREGPSSLSSLPAISSHSHPCPQPRLPLPPSLYPYDFFPSRFPFNRRLLTSRTKKGKRIRTYPPSRCFSTSRLMRVGYPQLPLTSLSPSFPLEAFDPPHSSSVFFTPHCVRSSATSVPSPLTPSSSIRAKYRRRASSGQTAH